MKAVAEAVVAGGSNGSNNGTNSGSSSGGSSCSRGECRLRRQQGAGVSIMAYHTNLMICGDD